MPGTIVIIDHDPHSVQLLESNLNREGYKTLTSDNGVIGLELVRKKPPALVILDIVLPDHDGLSVLKHLRTYQQTQSVPIIILTAKNEEVDRVLGLEMGADDYMTKPFSPRELIARIKAVLRRCDQSNTVNQDATPELIGDGEIRIDPQRHQVIVRGKVTELTPKEYNLLKLFVSCPGKAFTRSFLLELIWGYEYSGGTRTVDVHVRRLREKIETNPAKPVFIRTIWHIGYCFINPPE